MTPSDRLRLRVLLWVLAAAAGLFGAAFLVAVAAGPRGSGQ